MCSNFERKALPGRFAAIVFTAACVSLALYAQGTGATLWGTVRDAATRASLVADISIVSLERTQIQLWHARSDKNGWYEARSLPPGKKMLIARADGFGFAFREVMLVAGQVLEPVDFDLQRAAQVSGRVLDEQGLPLEGARVRVVYPSSPPVMLDWQTSETLTNPAGEFLLKNVTPNLDFYLEASHAEFPVLFSASSLRLATGEARQGVQLELRRGVTLAGQVLDSAAAPVAGAEVSFIAKQLHVADPTSGRSPGLQQEIHRRATTDSQGRFFFAGLGNGARLLLVHHPDSEPKEENLRLNRAVAPMVTVQVILLPKVR